MYKCLTNSQKTRKYCIFFQCFLKRHAYNANQLEQCSGSSLLHISGEEIHVIFLWTNSIVKFPYFSKEINLLACFLY